MTRKVLVLVFIFMILLSVLFETNCFGDVDIFENHGAIMLIIDPKTGEIEYANQAAATFYQYDVKTLESMNISEINILTDEEVKIEMNLAEQEMRNYFLFQHQLKDGSIHDVEIYSYPIEFDDRTLLFSIIFDITEELENKELLLQLNAEEEETLKKIIVVSFLIIVMIGMLLFVIYIKNRMLKHMNQYDKLTQVYNRTTLKDKYNRCNKTDFPISMHMIDVNNLKFINDTFGHIKGDYMIIAVAKQLSSMLCNPIVARVSGDEFVVLCLKTNDATMKKIEETIKTMSIEIDDISYNVSIGSVLLEDMRDYDLAFSIAESRMYNHKANHKNENNIRILNALMKKLYLNYPEYRTKFSKLKEILDFVALSLQISSEMKAVILEACEFHDIGIVATITHDVEDHVNKSYNIINALHNSQSLSTLCYYHHEKYDGSGWPKGLVGEDIPISARILIMCNIIYEISQISENVIEFCKSLEVEASLSIDPKMFKLIDQGSLEKLYEEINSK